MVTRRILFVDDEPLLLDTTARLLAHTHEVATAPGPMEGLSAIAKDGPFAVVVSDLRMPVMSGTAFLARVRELAPDSVRVLLSGGYDLESSTQAVMDGHIFRFLTKPCLHEHLIATLDACIEQHRLIRSERDVLEETVCGSIAILCDILAVIAPASFGRASHLRRYMRRMATDLELPDAWRFEMAGLLSQLGPLIASPETTQYVKGARSSGEGPRPSVGATPSGRHPQDMSRSAGAIAQELLARIPRLEEIARMIGGVQASPAGAAIDFTNGIPSPVALGSSMLRIAMELDRDVAQGTPLDQALAGMARQPAVFPPRLLHALETLRPIGHGCVPGAINMAQLAAGMILDEDVRDMRGTVLAARGTEATVPLVYRLEQEAKRAGVSEPFRVLVTADLAMDLAA